MGNQCCICQKKFKFLEAKISIAGFDMLCEQCQKRAGIYKPMHSLAEIKNLQSLTRREVLRLIDDDDIGIEDTFFEIDNKKYCSNCNCIVYETDEFCPNCRKRLLIPNERKTSIEFLGQKIKGYLSKEIELTKEGIKITQKKLHKFIPYSKIIDVEFVKASIAQKGYLSIITEHDGLTGYYDTTRPNDCRVLLLDQNTIIYPKKMNTQVEKVYNLIIYLMNNNDFDEEVEDISTDPLDINELDSMTGHDFEYFCAKLLQSNHFKNVKVTKGSGDQGVDVLAEKDGIKYAIQCKLYSTPLGNSPVQEVSAGKTFYGCHVGVVMTNSTFTTGAKELAKATNVLLWDRNKLEEFKKNCKV